jgi:hypothetical protein
MRSKEKRGKRVVFRVSGFCVQISDADASLVNIFAQRKGEKEKTHMRLASFSLLALREKNPPLAPLSLFSLLIS